MVKIIKGQIKGRAKRIGIVVGRFNAFITERLLKACLDELQKHGVSHRQITVVWVPGAFEIPLAAQSLAQKKTIDVVISLGCIIKGETLHYDLVAEQSSAGLMAVGLKSKKPIIFEVLATDTVKLAEARSQVKGPNKGRDAARVALEMVDVLNQVN